MNKTKVTKTGAKKPTVKKEKMISLSVGPKRVMEESLSLFHGATATDKIRNDMDQISKEMALYFANEIPTSKLAKWIAESTECWKDYHFHHDPINEMEVDDVFNLLNFFGWKLLPGLIECHSEEEKINFLQEELADVLESAGGYEGLKKRIGAIGSYYFVRNIDTVNDEDMVSGFMDTLTRLLCLTEKYYEYELLLKKWYEVDRIYPTPTQKAAI